jgi:hypothetical protein
MKFKSLRFLLLVLLLTSACAPSTIITEETPVPIGTEEPLPEPTQIAPESQPELPVVTDWRAVRDPRYGFGFAIPCWWLTNEIASDNGLYTVKNYDDVYFNANSSKGFWDWPNGTLKLDIVTMEGIDPALSDTDAFMQLSDPTMTSLVSAEQIQYGSHLATAVVVSSVNSPSDPPVKLFLFRFAPDKLLLVNPIPQSIIDTPDFQALLASVVLNADEQIALPLITPAPALIDASCAG